VGPCSIYEEEETLQFEEKLRSLQKELGDTIFLFMRAFVEKSRTSYDWRGFIYQPDISKPEDILTGIKRTKDLFSKLETPLAMECIDPSILPHLEHLLSWGFIGARTSSSTTHRILASSASIPFGFKNSLDGDVTSAIHSCVVAKESHCILTPAGQTFTTGNPYSHVVLRGGYNGVNYKQQIVENSISTSKEHGVHSPILIDCAHGNCPNKPDDQKTAFLSAVERYNERPDDILGVMVESNLHKGSNKSYKRHGVSFTDPCLSFEETRELLLYAADRITSRRKEGSNQPTSYACSH
jgi:3-deoxy-7-phosphoheptulonate synthase